MFKYEISEPCSTPFYQAGLDTADNSIYQIFERGFLDQSRHFFIDDVTEGIKNFTRRVSNTEFTAKFSNSIEETLLDDGPYVERNNKCPINFNNITNDYRYTEAGSLGLSLNNIYLENQIWDVETSHPFFNSEVFDQLASIQPKVWARGPTNHSLSCDSTKDMSRSQITLSMREME